MTTKLLLFSDISKFVHTDNFRSMQKYTIVKIGYVEIRVLWGSIVSSASRQPLVCGRKGLKVTIIKIPYNESK